MANVISEPFLPNASTIEEQVHVKRTTQDVSDLALEAKRDAEANPYNPELWIKYGRALRRQSMHREAIEAYSMGACYSPFYSLIYRHRAHAYLNISRYQEAASDFEFALRIDPENWDSWYHLGLSYFMMRDYIRAEKILKECYKGSDHPMNLVSCSDWLWMTLNRLGKADEANKLLDRIHVDMEVGVCSSYLQRLLMYKGEVKPEELISDDLEENSIELVTKGFGLANYYYVIGEDEKGDDMIRRTITAGNKGEGWSAFGYQAANVERKYRGL